MLGSPSRIWASTASISAGSRTSTSSCSTSTSQTCPATTSCGRCGWPTGAPPVPLPPGLDGSQNRVKGLGSGADDYLPKPFHKDELIARMQAIIRRSSEQTEAVLQCGDLTVNPRAQPAEVGGRPANLTGSEYKILALLAQRQGSTLTKEMLLNHLYGGMDEAEIKIIDVFICKLRRKLARASGGRSYIETMWGRGYMLREPHLVKAAS